MPRDPAFLARPQLPPHFLHSSLSFSIASSPKRPRSSPYSSLPKHFSPTNPPLPPPAHIPQNHPLHPLPPPPPFIPQTIEHALLLSKHALIHYLCSGRSRARLELPMGRSRKFWYRMSPLSMRLSESAILSLHFAKLFQGLRIFILVPSPDHDLQSIDWAHVTPLVDAQNDDAFNPEVADVVIIAGALKSQWRIVERVVKRSSNAKALVLFNCRLDTPLENGIAGFDDVYVCRAMDKVAVLKDGFGVGWSVFIEIAVFEYDWVGNKDEGWQPTQRACEAFVASRSARRRGLNGYYDSTGPGCEAGFWPFMTISSLRVPPIDGREMARLAKIKAEKARQANKRPFGFF